MQPQPASAVNGLVHAYLEGAHPSVATLFAKVTPTPCGAAARKHFGNKSLRQVVAAADDASSDSDAPPRKQLIVEIPAAKAPIADSDSDDEPVKKPVAAAKKASPALKPAVKKAPIADSDSDDEPVKKPVAAAKKASPALKPAAKKAPIADSDSDDEPVKKSVAAAKKASPALKAQAETSDDEEIADGTSTKRPAGDAADAAEDGRVAKAHRAEGNHSGAYNGNRQNAAPKGGPYQRFQRIDPTKVTFINDALRCNRPGMEASTFRQNQEMMRVRGKEFNKHKQKNKGKLYSAGVIEDIRSFKFDDDE